MKRRDVLAAMPLPVVMSGCASTAFNVADRNSCAEKMDIEEFKDVLWSIVELGASSFSRSAKFEDAGMCRTAYQNQTTWYNNFVGRYESDSRNPCNLADHAYFAENYYYCVFQTGFKAASITKKNNEDLKNIPTPNFKTAMQQMNAFMAKLSSDPRFLAHLCT